MTSDNSNEVRRPRQRRKYPRGVKRVDRLQVTQLCGHVVLLPDATARYTNPHLRDLISKACPNCEDDYK
jgi:hypothetical protein